MLTIRMAWRNAWRNPRRMAVVVTAAAVGVAGCLLSMAVNYGMVVQMVDTAIATELGHLQIHGAGFDAGPELEIRLRDGGRRSGEALRELEEVRAWTRRVIGQGLVSSPRASAGVRVVGIEPEREAAVSLVADSLVAGAYLDGDRRRVLVGEELAARLQVGVGDKLVLTVQDLHGDLTGEALRVGGVFRTPSRELDRGTLYMRLDAGQALLGLDDAISEIVVVAERREAIPRLRAALSRRLPDAEVRTWEELRPVLVYMVESFDQMAGYVYAAVFIAMAFGIANVLMMAVYERMREIGILMAIGMGRTRLVCTIVIESIVMTLLGLVLGFAVAIGAAAALSDGIDLSRWAEGLNAYGIGTRIVPVLRRTDFAVPTLVALATAVAASAWPALRAVRFRPAEAVRQT